MTDTQGAAAQICPFSNHLAFIAGPPKPGVKIDIPGAAGLRGQAEIPVQAIPAHQPCVREHCALWLSDYQKCSYVVQAESLVQCLHGMIAMGSALAEIKQAAALPRV